MSIVIIYGLMNIVGYFLMTIDKKKAVKKRRRVRERTIFLLAFLGGALGILYAMKKKRHKTMHSSFQIGIPLLTFLNVCVYAGLFDLLYT